MQCVVRPGWSWRVENNGKPFTASELEVVDIDIETLTPAHTRALFVPENDKALAGKNTREEVARFNALVEQHAANERKADEDFRTERAKAVQGAKEIEILKATNKALAEQCARQARDLEEARATIEALTTPAKPAARKAPAIAPAESKPTEG